MRSSASADSLPKPFPHRLFALYVSAIAVVTVVYGWHNVEAANDYAIGEWLINYSAGFVRRGLFGQLVLLLSRVTHSPIFFVTLALQITLYWTFFWNVFCLTRGLRWSLPLAAVLLSPATLAFSVLDPPAAFHKEAILFAGLSILVRLLVDRSPPPWLLVLYLFVFTQFAVLSHEPLVLYLPYVFGAVFLAIPHARRAALICIAPAVLAAISVFISSRHPGDANSAAIICASVGARLGTINEGVCGGAILYLSRSLAYARFDVNRLIRAYHYFVLYPIVLLLAAAPFGLLFRSLSCQASAAPALRRALHLVYRTTALAAITSIPLFVVATDWGRWIYMHAVCLMLLVLLVLHRTDADRFIRAGSPNTTSGSAVPAKASTRTPPKALALAALVLYATCWTLPGVGIFPGRFGYLSLVRYFAGYNRLPHAVPKQHSKEKDRKS